MNLVEELHL